MIYLANLGVLFVAILHLWFCILEMFLWQKPIGLKIFHLNSELARQSATLAANQGLYNAFLSAGLFWSLITYYPEAEHLQIFFLSCIMIAGIYAGITVNRRIFFVQSVPAIVTLIMVLLAH